ncbi:MAG: GNAT family N-acetyltransferase [Anaerolineae bacterium]|nr:GNAT family N-acetyltransferase [Anaerolineae bacterium]MDW8101145.1 GNAT family N-acetyltransferase [Anaerolineae bacterium]
MPAGIAIRKMTERDVDEVARTFAVWRRSRALYQRYFSEQLMGDRLVLVAWCGRKAVGYVTVVWESTYEPFRRAGIPEIVDLSVITEYQRRGIGTALIHAAEDAARQRTCARIGISVVQSPEYAAANRLYPKLGYVPDGRGITWYDNELHLVKTLDGRDATEGLEGGGETSSGQ